MHAVRVTSRWRGFSSTAVLTRTQQTIHRDSTITFAGFRGPHSRRGIFHKRGGWLSLPACPLPIPTSRWACYTRVAQDGGAGAGRERACRRGKCEQRLGVGRMSVEKDAVRPPELGEAPLAARCRHRGRPSQSCSHSESIDSQSALCCISRQTLSR